MPGSTPHEREFSGKPLPGPTGRGHLSGLEIPTGYDVMMRILLVTDAWLPQVNGVVRTLQNTAAELEGMGHEVTVIGPDRFRTMPCPGYREIRLSLIPGRRMRRLIDVGNFDAIHIATEGPLGMSARRWCLRRGLAFTTSYHTRFPEYLRLRAPIPLKTSYAWLRRFHGAASRTLVRTETQKAELEGRGFRNLSVWPGGVNTALFRPRDKGFLDLPRPIAIYVGRVAPEKSVEDFLRLEFEGSKVIVGDGPSRTALEAAYPGTHFLGYRHGEELARALAAADVFVFPSRTDTLGLVMLEAMACGLPVAAYPVPGPQDVVVDGKTGCLRGDLGKAIECALGLNPKDCVESAAESSWRRCTERFLQMLKPLRQPAHDGTSHTERANLTHA